MSWWWFGIWFALVVLACGVFAVLGRTLWVKAGLVLREMGQAGERLGDLQSRLDELATSTQARREELAVFDDPTNLRARRIRERKAHERSRARAKARAARSLSATGDRRAGTAT